VVNEAYGNIKISEYGMQLYSRDGSVLSVGFCGEGQVHVWVTDADGRARVRVLVDEDIAINTEISTGWHSATDFASELLYASYAVVYDEVEGYLHDKADVGGRELVFEWVGTEGKG
jgi:hypothetical protein